MRIDDTVKAPSGPVIAVRIAVDVRASITATVTAGRTPPFMSRTMPVTDAGGRADCATAGGVKTSNETRAELRPCIACWRLTRNRTTV